MTTMKSLAFSVSSSTLSRAAAPSLNHSAFTCHTLSLRTPSLNTISRNTAHVQRRQRRSSICMTSSSPSPTTTTNTPRPRTSRKKIKNKRICVLSDGTWNKPENPIPSNIVRLTQCIDGVDDNGVHQLVMYDRGIGTAGGADRWIGGAFGDGIDKNIEELYSFLALNYEDGDEVYMFGFSRGAYTVRSLAGMINDVGLVRRESMAEIKPAYDLYRENLPLESDRLVEFRETHGDRIPIEAVVCFDTVGSLGIPSSVGWLNGLTRENYEFHDTTLSAGIKHAIHAVALDEERSLMTPTFMKPHPDVANQVTAKFFWGSHGGIGGSEATEQEAGQCTLRFVIDEMKRRGLGLKIDEENPVVPDQYPNLTFDREITSGKSGPISFFNQFTGRFVRPVPEHTNVHFTAVRRFQSVASWRPDSLAPHADDLLAADANELEAAYPALPNTMPNE